VLVAAGAAFAHDLPNARVDRSTQVTLEASSVRIDYEVSLAELTLFEELRSLVGPPSAVDRAALFDLYGRTTAPMNAKGLFVWLDGVPVELTEKGFDLAVEEHPRFTFHYAAPLGADRGSLRIRDTNFAASQGTSRLAVRGVGVSVQGDGRPEDVEAIPARPVWQLSDEEERATREETVSFRSPSATADRQQTEVPAQTTRAAARAGAGGVSWLLDAADRWPLAWLAVLAGLLGGAHALQPGHGLTLVAATASGPGGSARAAVLALVVVTTHAGGVLLLAAILWKAGAFDMTSVHLALARGSGFVIGAVGCWRLGRLVGGFSDHPHSHVPTTARWGGVIGLGAAGGAAPCWDVVALVVLAAAVGRFGLGVFLALAFSVGMVCVLLALGWLAARAGASLRALDGGGAWEKRLAALSGVVLTVMGAALMAS
jgi:ABC-type nickel/cobalt efflux system permease component RcnA